MKVNDSLPNAVSSAAIAQYKRVKFDGSGKLELAGETDAELGTTTHPTFNADEQQGVHTATPGCTYVMEAGGAFAQYATVYGAADGAVDDVSNANPIGIALEAATAAGDRVLVLRR